MSVVPSNNRLSIFNLSLLLEKKISQWNWDMKGLLKNPSLQNYFCIYRLDSKKAET